MQLERFEQFRGRDLVPHASSHTGRVVKHDPCGCPADMLENGAEAIAHALRGLARQHDRVSRVRVRPRNHEHVSDYALPTDDRDGFTKI